MSRWQWRWAYVLPILIVTGAIAWIAMTPTMECFDSIGDDQGCRDWTGEKQIVMGAALLLAALVFLAIWYGSRDSRGRERQE